MGSVNQSDHHTHKWERGEGAWHESIPECHCPRLITESHPQCVPNVSSAGAGTAPNSSSDMSCSSFITQLDYVEYAYIHLFVDFRICDVFNLRLAYTGENKV